MKYFLPHINKNSEKIKKVITSSKDKNKHNVAIKANFQTQHHVYNANKLHAENIRLMKEIRSLKAKRNSLQAEAEMVQKIIKITACTLGETEDSSKSLNKNPE